MFGGRQQLSRVAVSGRVEQWLVARAAQIAGLELEEPAAARTAVQLIQALEEATEFQQLGANLQVPPGPSDPSQVTQYLAETRAGLLEMVKLTQAQDDVLVQVGRLYSSSSLSTSTAPNPGGLQLRVAGGARHDPPDARAGGPPPSTSPAR